MPQLGFPSWPSVTELVQTSFLHTPDRSPFVHMHGVLHGSLLCPSPIYLRPVLCLTSSLSLQCSSTHQQHNRRCRQTASWDKDCCHQVRGDWGYIREYYQAPQCEAEHVSKTLGYSPYQLSPYEYENQLCGPFTELLCCFELCSSFHSHIPSHHKLTGL